jgi:hypothetical protein
VTGHSLGGALAYHALVYLTNVINNYYNREDLLLVNSILLVHLEWEIRISSNMLINNYSQALNTELPIIEIQYHIFQL